jgi:hypothetical protein
MGGECNIHDATEIYPKLTSERTRDEINLGADLKIISKSGFGNSRNVWPLFTESRHCQVTTFVNRVNSFYFHES